MAGPYDTGGNYQPLSPNFSYFQVLPSPPSVGSTGRSYFDTTLGIGVYAGGIWNYASGGGGGGNVASVFGRTGIISAQSGDYTFAQLASKPSTLAGYNITDPIVLTSGSYSNPSWITGLAWSKVSTTPTTISGYGIIDPIVLTSGSYSNPSWITTLGWSKITSTPTTIAGYGITDGVTLTGTQTLSNKTITGYQPALSLTTTGTSGAATLTSNTLNIPQYSTTGGSVLTKFSVQGTGVSGTEINLVNDIATPGLGYFYGAQPALIGTRGYYEIEENFLGTIYDQVTWADATTGFTNRGATVSVVGGALVFSAGTNTFTQTLEINGSSMLDNWTVEGNVLVESNNANATDGFGFGKRSTNVYGSSNALVRFITGSGTGTGTIQLYGGTTNILLATSTALTFSIGDNIFISVTRDGYTITATARNVTTNSALVTITFLFVTNPTVDPVMDNTGRYGMFSFGGGFNVTHFKVRSNVSKNARLALLGDSKTQGYAVTAQQNRLSDLLNNKYRSTINLGGGYDRTIEYLLRVNEIISLRPQQLLICAASNDPRSGVASGTTNTNYDSIVSSFLAAGIDVYHFLPFYESGGNNQTPLSTHISATYPANKIIDGTSPTMRLNSLYTDNIHLTDYGNINLFNAVIEFGLLYAGNTRYSLPSIGGSITGSGTINTIPKFTSSSAIGNSSLVDNGVSIIATEPIQVNNGGITLNSTAAPLDQKLWNYYANTNSVNFSTVNDAGTTNFNYLSAIRSGTTVTSLTSTARVIVNNTTAPALTLTNIASGANIIMTGTVTGNILPIQITASISNGISSQFTNQSAAATAYNNIYLAVAGTTGANANIAFQNKTTNAEWVAGIQVSGDNFVIGTGINFFSDFLATSPFRLTTTGLTGIGGVATPTARLHIVAGTATASQAPLKFTSGVNLTTTEAGAVEYDGSHLYFTAANAGTRYQLDQQTGALIKYQHTIFTPTTGGTVALVTGQYNIINPAGALLALTVNLPSTPANNDTVYIKFTQNVTTVTYGNGTVVDGITAPTAGGLTVLTYDSGTTSWY